MDDNETYFELRTTHLYDSEKNQLLEYINHNEEDVRGIDFWLMMNCKGVINNEDVFDHLIDEGDE